MKCGVCYTTCQDGGPVVPKHLNSLGMVCPMSGQPSFVWDERSTREAVAGRSNGICEFCRAALATDMHHRMSRGVGGWWSPANVIHLCRGCHARATDHPAWAYKFGLSVRSTDDPAEVPVMCMTMLVLTDDVAPPRRNGRKKRS